MILSEPELLDRVKSARRVLLIEPGYKRKYPPLALMKLATYVRECRGMSKFARGALGEKCDLICMTSLFTYDQRYVRQAVAQAQDLCPGVPIIVGGVLASLMSDKVEALGVDVFKGYSKTLDALEPDYSRNWQIEEPWDQFSFSFTSRGCPNRCGYCAVWKIEQEAWVNPNWRAGINLGKPNAMISDNNLSATPDEHWHELIDYLARNKRGVVFDNGLDCKRITEDMARDLARLKFTRSGMRMAFDRIKEDGVFQLAIERLIAAGVPRGEIMAYVLFNFKDSPREAHYRMSECRRLGIRPYPQKFTPLDWTTRRRSFIGRKWTRNLASRFRHYWLMAGIYTKQTIEDFFRHEGSLTAEDWAAWNRDSEKWESGTSSPRDR